MLGHTHNFTQTTSIIFSSLQRRLMLWCIFQININFLQFDWPTLTSKLYIMSMQIIPLYYSLDYQSYCEQYYHYIRREINQTLQHFTTPLQPKLTKFIQTRNFFQPFKSSINFYFFLFDCIYSSIKRKITYKLFLYIFFKCLTTP